MFSFSIKEGVQRDLKIFVHVGLGEVRGGGYSDLEDEWNPGCGEGGVLG